MNRRDLPKFVELRKLLKEELKPEEFGFFAEHLTDDLAYK